MITLTGKLRQHGEITWEGKTRLKVWIEHETPRDNGAADLKIEELFLPQESVTSLPKKDASISVVVRAYVSGRDIKFQAIGLAPVHGQAMEKTLEAKKP